MDERCQSLIEDVEDAPVAGCHGADAGLSIMVPRPLGFRLPLQMVRCGNSRVLCYGVVVSIMKKVRPFIDVRRPRLFNDLPSPAAFEIGDSFRAQDTQNFIHGNVAEVLGH